jgi:hypothetical protein
MQIKKKIIKEELIKEGKRVKLTPILFRDNFKWYNVLVSSYLITRGYFKFHVIVVRD